MNDINDYNKMRANIKLRISNSQKRYKSSKHLTINDDFSNVGPTPKNQRASPKVNP